MESGQPEHDLDQEQRREAGRLFAVAAEMFQYDVPNTGWVADMTAELCSWSELDKSAPQYAVWARRPRQYESDLSIISVAAAREAFDRHDWDLLARVVMMSTQCAVRFREWLEARDLLVEADAQRPLDLHLSRPTAHPPA